MSVENQSFNAYWVDLERRRRLKEEKLKPPKEVIHIAKRSELKPPVRELKK